MLKAATAQELPVEQAILTAAWDMLKEFHNIDINDNEGEWEQVIKKTSRLYELGNGKPETEALAHGLALSIDRYLQNISRAEKSRACIVEMPQRNEREEALKKRISSL